MQFGAEIKWKYTVIDDVNWLSLTDNCIRNVDNEMFKVADSFKM